MRILTPLLFVASAHAELLSPHNEEHVAVQAAVSDFHKQGCLLTHTTRSGQYERHSTTDRSAQNIIGKVLTTRCVLWPDAPVVISHELTWSHANRRTDGKPLPIGEVAGYELEHNGTVNMLGVVVRHTLTDTTFGSDSYRLRTVDTLGQRGPWSDFVRL